MNKMLTMKRILATTICSLLPVLAINASAGDNLTLDSAIGGAVGGAIGGAVGAEVGGRDGAIIGAGVGAAAGTAINTKDSDYHHKDGHASEAVHDVVHHSSNYHGHKSRFCPPGQAKKGRC